MTNKEIVQDLLRRIPDDASLREDCAGAEVHCCCPTRLTELDNGDSVSIEEVENELAVPLKKFEVANATSKEFETE